MSGLAGRDPGVIGAVLNNPECYSAIIPDLKHVHPANIQIAVKIKPDHMFIVTDCHAAAGTDQTQFELNGRTMYVRDGMCTNKEGVLTGSIILMNQGLKNCFLGCQLPLEKSLQMATVNPAKVMRIDHVIGRLAPGLPANQVVAIKLNDFSCKFVIKSETKPTVQPFIELTQLQPDQITEIKHNQ